MNYRELLKENPPDDPVILDRLQRLQSGCVLLATERLSDPNFDVTVVMICVHDEKGTYGLVLNRPSHMPLSEMFDGFQGIMQKRKIYMGGPVGQEIIQIVELTDKPAEGSYEIVPRVHMGGEWNNVRDVVQHDDPRLRLFLGYSGWGAGQLEYEIARGAWEVYVLNIEKLLVGPEQAWSGGYDKIDAYLRSLAEPAAS